MGYGEDYLNPEIRKILDCVPKNHPRFDALRVALMKIKEKYEYYFSFPQSQDSVRDANRKYSDLIAETTMRVLEIHPLASWEKNLFKIILS